MKNGGKMEKLNCGKMVEKWKNGKIEMRLDNTFLLSLQILRETILFINCIIGPQIDYLNTQNFQNNFSNLLSLIHKILSNSDINDT